MFVKFNFFDLKGILDGGVWLGDSKLGHWKACLTHNFVPYYQIKVGSKNKISTDEKLNKPFIDIVAKYKTSDRLLIHQEYKLF